MKPSSSSSSAKKVAKLAQRGRGKKVRFQGGTLFPAVVVGVMIVGLLTIVYARQSRPDPGSFPPQIGDHWHAAIGTYVCDGWLPKLSGDQEEKVTDSQGNESFTNSDFAVSGVHSHDDGVIHYHPFSANSIGKRAKLGILLDVYGIELDTDRLKLPEAQGGEEYDVDDFQCKGEKVEIKVVAWDNYSDTGNGSTYITELADTKIRQDHMVFAIVVAPKGADIAMPPWASELPELGAADGGNVPTTTVQGTAGSTLTSDAATDDTSTIDTESSDPANSEPLAPDASTVTTAAGD